MPRNLYTEPMPSPNGTNYERLYIVRKPFAEAMAFDAAMPNDPMMLSAAAMSLPHSSSATSGTMTSSALAVTGALARFSSERSWVAA